MSDIRRLLLTERSDKSIERKSPIIKWELALSDERKSPPLVSPFTPEGEGRIILMALCQDRSEIVLPTSAVVYRTTRPAEIELASLFGKPCKVSVACYEQDVLTFTQTIDLHDLALTHVIPLLEEGRCILWESMVDRILQYLQSHIRSGADTMYVHNELQGIASVCSSAMNISWVIGKGEWANVPDVGVFTCPQDGFQEKLEQAWRESDFKRDMLNTALRIDWSRERENAIGPSRLRMTWELDESVSDESILRIATWFGDVFGGVSRYYKDCYQPAHVQEIPGWKDLTKKLHTQVMGEEKLEGGPGRGTSWKLVGELRKVIEDRMQSLGFGLNDFARRRLPPHLIGKSRYSFEEMVLVYESLDNSGTQRARENCLCDAWGMTYGTDALVRRVYESLEKYAERIQSFLLPTGKSAYFLCIAAMPNVERGWKRLIVSVLRECYGDVDTAWSEGVPKEIRKAAAGLSEEKKGKRSKWDCLYFIDLKTILDKNWKLFEPRIASRNRFTKKYLMASFERLNDIRNDLAHPTEDQTFEYADEIDTFLRDIKQLMNEVMGKQIDEERKAGMRDLGNHPYFGAPPA